jgi:hypothetical protein
VQRPSPACCSTCCSVMPKQEQTYTRSPPIKTQEMR